MTAFIASAGGIEVVAARFAALVGTIGVIGAGAFRLAVVRERRGAGRTIGEVGPEVAATFGLASAIVLLAATALRLWLQAEAFAEPGGSPMTMMGPVLGTAWGKAAFAQLVGAGAAAVAFNGARHRRRWSRALAGSAVLVLCLTPPFMGHAAAEPRFAALAMGLDAIHVAAAGGWAGAVAVLVVTLRALARLADGAEAAATLIERFRPLALSCAGALAVTGAGANLFRIRSPADFVATDYGLVMAAKLALVGAAVFLGWRHSRSAASAVRAGRQGAVTRSIAAEVGVMTAIIGVTSILTGTAPPGE